MHQTAKLPPGLVAYRETPLFNEKTIPAGLLREHRTRAGTWGVITVVEGRLRFRLLAPPSETILSPGRPGIVAPEQPHEVAPDGPVKFYVVFCHALTPAAMPPAAATHEIDVIPGSGPRPRPGMTETNRSGVDRVSSLRSSRRRVPRS